MLRRCVREENRREERGGEEMKEGERDRGGRCAKAGQSVEPSTRAGKGAACSVVGGSEETLRLKQAINSPVSSSGPPRSLGKGVSHGHGPSFVTACWTGLSPWL